MTPERYAKMVSVLNRRQPDLTVITDKVHKGRNLSAIVRTCDAVGIDTVHSVVEAGHYRTYRGTASGSHKWVETKRYDDLSSPVHHLKNKGFQIIAAHVGDAVKDYREIDYSLPTALLLGTERFGLDEQALEMADQHITIPMLGMVDSYNVSVACAIILSEAQRQRTVRGFYNARRLSDEDYQRRFFQWAHPKVANYCHKHGYAYPEVNQFGEIIEPSAWLKMHPPSKPVRA